MSRIACIYHSIDLDGWMSAAIIKHWWSLSNNITFEHNDKDYPTYIIGNDTDSVFFIGYNYGQKIPYLNDYDKVIMCDISFPKVNMVELYNRLGKNFIWIDHHISAIRDIGDIYNDLICGKRNTNFAACELTWLHISELPIPEIVRLLGRYDCFGHKGTIEEQEVLEFQYGARQVISNVDSAYKYLIDDISKNNVVWNIHQSGILIYRFLCTDAKQSYSNGFELVLNEPDSFYNGENGTLNDQLRKFVCINKERFNPINFGIDYHKDGYDGAACFYRMKDGKWSFSLYNDNGLVDCSEIAKQYGGGGHKGASGFVIENINDIIK